MKKYIYTLFAAIAMLASCTNDDININYEKDEHFYQTFAYNVSPQPAYDTFNATSTLKNRFLSGEYGDYCLGIYTYIYDNDGNLVKENFTTSKTFGLVSNDFNLEYGKYTAVTVEMIVDKDDNYRSDAFEMRNTDKLSTIEVGYRKKKNDQGEEYYETYSVWYESVGVSTHDFVVDANTKAIDITPKAVGCVINSKFYNFDKCKDKNLLVIATKNCPIGRRLDPTLKGNDRFVYEKYNPGTNAELRWTRYSSANSFKEEEGADVYLLEEGNDLECGIGAGNYIIGKGSSWYSAKRNILSDGKIYYAGSYYVGKANSTGLDGGIFDTQSEFNTWYNKAKNMYVPEVTFSLTTPNTKWKSSVSAVQSSMSGYTMFLGTNGKAENMGDNYVVGYAGNGFESMIVYYFDTMTTGLYEADVYYDLSTVTLKQLQTSLEANNTFLAEQEGISMYVTSDYNTIIGLMKLDDSYIVEYLDASLLMSGSNVQSIAATMVKKMQTSPIKSMNNSNYSKTNMIPFKSTKAIQRM